MGQYNCKLRLSGEILPEVLIELSEIMLKNHAYFIEKDSTSTKYLNLAQIAQKMEDNKDISFFQKERGLIYPEIKDFLNKHNVDYAWIATESGTQTIAHLSHKTKTEKFVFVNNSLFLSLEDIPNSNISEIIFWKNFFSSMHLKVAKSGHEQIEMHKKSIKTKLEQEYIIMRKDFRIKD